MLRVRSNESTVFGGASTGKGSRYRAKKTTRRVATVIDALEQELVKRKCHTCETMIECNVKPISAPSGHGMIVPKYTAPLICLECRKDKTKFYIARKAMLEMFGWEDTHTGHGWER